MLPAATPFRLSLFGPFKLQEADGTRIEISSRKGAALLAMLAMAKEGERTRVWLQDKLWGSREPNQARGSLRRELSNLRRCLRGPAAALLICERDRVRLDLHLLHVDALSDTPGDGATGDFLEGLDIAGEDDFEDWLRQQRNELKRRFGRTDADGAAPLLPSRFVDLSKPAPGFGGRPAVAVLPFRNLTGDSANDYLSEGFGEELIDRLSRLRWLPVIARSSSFSLPADDTDHLGIGQKLGARYLLEGRLRVLDELYRLNVGLTDTESGYVLWSRRVDLPKRCSPESLDQLVSDVVAVLDTRIDHAEQIRARITPSSGPDVHELIWRGRWHLNRFTREDAAIARDLFAEALALDPGSTEAQIQATFCLGWSLWAQRGEQHEIVEMRRMAQRAIDADCDDSRGHMLAGIAEMWLRNTLQARTLFERAIALNPSLALAHAQLGGSYSLAGEPDKAIAPLKTALRLSPNDTHLFYTLGELGIASVMLERWSDAIDYASQSLIRRPAYWYAHAIRINALVRNGQRQAAHVAYDDLIKLKPNFASEYVEWLPFVDRHWIDFFTEGLSIAAQNPFLTAVRGKAASP